MMSGERDRRVEPCKRVAIKSVVRYLTAVYHKEVVDHETVP